jgi:hypothetical protein
MSRPIHAEQSVVVARVARSGLVGGGRFARGAQDGENRLLRPIARTARSGLRGDLARLRESLEAEVNVVMCGTAVAIGTGVATERCGWIRVVRSSLSLSWS